MYSSIEKLTIIVRVDQCTIWYRCFEISLPGNEALECLGLRRYKGGWSQQQKTKFKLLALDNLNHTKSGFTYITYHTKLTVKERNEW